MPEKITDLINYIDKQPDNDIGPKRRAKIKALERLVESEIVELPLGYKDALVVWLERDAKALTLGKTVAGNLVEKKFDEKPVLDLLGGIPDIAPYLRWRASGLGFASRQSHFIMHQLEYNLATGYGLISDEEEDPSIGERENGPRITVPLLFDGENYQIEGEANLIPLVKLNTVPENRHLFTRVRRKAIASFVIDPDFKLAFNDPEFTVSTGQAKSTAEILDPWLRGFTRGDRSIFEIVDADDSITTKCSMFNTARLSPAYQILIKKVEELAS